MKKLYFVLTFLFISSVVYSQNEFTNAGGNNLWSNAANWSESSFPNAADAKVVIKADSVIVDGDYTVAQIKFPSKDAGGVDVTTFTNLNNGTLTITGNGVSQVLQLNKNPQSVIFNLPVIFDSSEDAQETWIFNSGNQKITFGEDHSLTINDEIFFTSTQVTSEILFNGKTLGAGNLKFGAKSNAKFGTAYDGSEYTGTLIVAGDSANSGKNVTLTSNVADNGTFVKSGASISVIKNGGTVNVNGENTLKGNIVLTGQFGLALNINKNQDDVGTITMGSGILTLKAPTALTKIAFANNSSADWGTGKLVITGANNKEVSFGSDANGLTADQLSQISLNGATPEINASGQIYTSSVLISTFTNAGNDNLWSNAANWSLGIPTGDTAKITIDADLIVDSDRTVAQIKNNGKTSADSLTITAINSSKLTVTGTGVTQPIQNNKASSSFVFNLPVVFDSEGETETMKINAGGDESSGFANITFSSTLNFK